MSFTAILLCLLLPALLDTAWVAFFRAQAVGKFKVLRLGDAICTFESALGKFSIYPKERRIEFLGRSREPLAFDQIRGIEYRVNEQHAVLQELFFGYDLTDTLAKYGDTVDWFSLAVITHERKRVPLFISGQYNRRELLLGWYIELQSRLLQKLHLLTDVAAQSQEAMELIREKLGNPKLL